MSKFATSFEGTIFNSSNVATYRTAVATVSEALTSAGLIKTGDTGQLDIPAISTKTANTYNGYEIRILNDSQHATVPWYFKFEYGTGGTVSTFNLRVTVGTGSDGAGSITNVVLAATVLSPSSISSGQSTLMTYMSDGIFWLGLVGPSAYYGVMQFAAFRSQDPVTGAFGPDLMLMYGDGTTVNYLCQMTVRCVTRASLQVRTLSASSTDFFSMPFTGRGSGLPNGRLVSPAFGCYPQIARTDGLMMTREGEFSPWQTFTAPGIAANRTYIQFPTFQNQTTKAYFAFLWE